MPEMRIVDVAPRPFAGVRRVVTHGEVPRELRAGLDTVWAAVSAGSLPRGGRNVALYRGLGDGTLEMDCGVEVERAFEPIGEVTLHATPPGRALWGRHVGPIERLSETYDAMARHAREAGLALGASSWELYGHWRDDPASYEIDVYLLLDAERPAPS